MYGSFSFFFFNFYSQVKDPWPRVLSLPRAQGGFVGDPISLARDNIMQWSISETACGHVVLFFLRVDYLSPGKWRYIRDNIKIWQKFAIFTVYNRAFDPLPTSIFTAEFPSDPIPFMAQVMLNLHISRYYSLEIVTLNIKKYCTIA